MRNDAKPANLPAISDDRIRCSDCCQLSPSGVCRIASIDSQRVVARRGYQPVPNLPRRCAGFTPQGDNPDQRQGFERWPGLLAR